MAGDNKSYGIKQKLMRGKLSAFIICLIISGFLWMANRLNQTYSYSINVPVKFINLPTNKILLSELPTRLRCDIKTSGLKLFFVLLNRPFPELTIDFNTLKSDNKSQWYTLSYESVNLKSATKLDVNIKKISPDTLFFANKRGITKNVAIKPLIYASPDKGTIISKPVITPAFITISGDSLSINSIDSISTAPLYLNALSSNYTGKLNLIRPNENIFLSVFEVGVSIKADKLLEKQIEIPVNVINTKDESTVKLFPAKVKVTYSAAMNDFNDISAANFKAVVDMNKQNNTTNKLMVELSLVPTQCKVLLIEPSEVEFLKFKSK